MNSEDLKDTCQTMLIVAIFTIVGVCNPTECLSQDEGLKKTWCMYKMKYYCVMKNSGSLSFMPTSKELEYTLPFK
jgi:hypothetical protein